MSNSDLKLIVDVSMPDPPKLITLRSNPADSTAYIRTKLREIGFSRKFGTYTHKTTNPWDEE